MDIRDVLYRRELLNLNIDVDIFPLWSQGVTLLSMGLLIYCDLLLLFNNLSVITTSSVTVHIRIRIHIYVLDLSIVSFGLARAFNETWVGSYIGPSLLSGRDEVLLLRSNAHFGLGICIVNEFWISQNKWRVLGLLFGRLLSRLNRLSIRAGRDGSVVVFSCYRLGLRDVSFLLHFTRAVVPGLQTAVLGVAHYWNVIIEWRLKSISGESVFRSGILLRNFEFVNAIIQSGIKHPSFIGIALFNLLIDDSLHSLLWFIRQIAGDPRRNSLILQSLARWVPVQVLLVSTPLVREVSLGLNVALV